MCLIEEKVSRKVTSDCRYEIYLWQNQRRKLEY